MKYNKKETRRILDRAAWITLESGKASCGEIAKRCKIGKQSAEKIINLLEACGIINAEGKARYSIDEYDKLPAIYSLLAVSLYDERGEWEEYINRKLSIETNPEMKRARRAYLEGERDHSLHFAAWEETTLRPQVCLLEVHARHDPQYDWQYLYILERQKLVCMRTYFATCRFTEEAINRRLRWIDLCIRLLGGILCDGDYRITYGYATTEITEKDLLRLNLRNIGGLVSVETLDKFHLAVRRHNHLDIHVFGRLIYTRKLERLYYRVRLEKIREWWE